MGRCRWLLSRTRRSRPPPEGPDEEQERLNGMVEAKIQASLASESKRFATVHLVCLLGYVFLYLVAKLAWLQMNYLPAVTSSGAVVVHALARLAHVRRGRGRFSLQGGHTLAVCVNGLLSAVANPEVQYFIHSTRFAPLVRPFGERPLCPTRSGSIDGRCLMEAASADSVMFLLVTCSFFVVFILDMRHALAGATFMMVSYHATWVWARLPWVLAYPPNHIVSFVISYTLIGLMLAAKWKIEKSQRQLTVELVQRERQVVQEKVKRYEVEFKYATLERNDIDAARGAASVVSSALPSSAAVFQCISPDADTGEGGEWQQLVNLGRREHWFIDVQDLQLQPENVLGRGGFGVVVRGTFVGSPVAVKIARNWGIGNGMLELANELRIFRHVRHPNIALFHGACFDPTADIMAVVLELVQGTNLDAYVRDGKVDDHADGDLGRHMILLDICRALLYLHTREPSIIHGDVKPLNMMVEDMRGAPRVKLLDFGLSRVLTAHAPGLGGTRPWMAPEVAGRRGARPTSAADIYSFGCVALFVATGRRPDDALPEQWGGRGGGPHGAVWLPASASRRCQLLVEGCLRQLPEQRPSAAQIHEDLATWPWDLSGASDESVGDGPGVSWTDAVQQLKRTAQGEGQGRRRRNPTGEPGQPPAAAELPPEAAADAAGGTQTELRQTPRHTQCLMLCETLLRWHCKASARTCCAFHAALRDAVDACREMQAHGCKPDLVREAQEGYEQCPRCGALEGVSQDGQTVQCYVCVDAPAEERSVPLELRGQRRNAAGLAVLAL